MLSMSAHRSRQNHSLQAVEGTEDKQWLSPYRQNRSIHTSVVQVTGGKHTSFPNGENKPILTIKNQEDNKGNGEKNFKKDWKGYGGGREKGEMPFI